MNSIVPSSQRPTGGEHHGHSVWAPIRQYDAESAGTTVDLGRLLLILRRRWWLIVSLAGGFGVAAWYQVRQQPNVYQASAVVQLLDSRNTLASGLVKDDNYRIPAMFLTASQ